MAVFDVVVNNADRKGAHILAMPGGHRCGVGHGLTFHVEDKLRTVLRGWLGRGLTELLSAEEVKASAERCTQLLDGGIFPAPNGLTPAVPRPLF